MSIYTGNGDTGRTTLADGTDLKKSDDVIRCLGAVDELAAHLGVIRAASDINTSAFIYDIQQKLLDIGAFIATREERFDMNDADVTGIEHRIDELEAQLPPMRAFVIPGDTSRGAVIHVARTVCRRAETYAVDILKNSVAQRYINRLSDYLFCLARLADKKTEGSEMQQVAVQQSVMNLESANQIIQSVIADASDMNVNVVVAVTDTSGNPIAVNVMDGAFIVSFELALSKAYTAAVLRRATAELGTLTKPGDALYGIETTTQGKLTSIGGGVPIYRGGVLVGGLGISGGTAEQDIELANRAREAFG